MTDIPGAPRRRLVIEGGHVVTMNDDGDVHHGGTLVIEDDRIVAVVPEGGEVPGASPADEVIDATGQAVLPGLVDLHLHTDIDRAGYTESKELWDALTQHWYPKMRALDPETTYRCALYSYMEFIRSGTTTVNDMFRQVEACAQAAAEIGVRATLSSLVAMPEDGLDGLEDNARAFQAVHGMADDRIRVHVGIEWLPLASQELLREARALADEFGSGIHIHLNESLPELESSRERFGRRSLEVAYDCGILGPDCVAAHCVWLTDAEIALLRETGTHVAHNPMSNAKMGEGLARVPEMLAAGVNVGLGHDSTEGNNCSDMFEVMRATALMQRATRVDPTILRAPEVLRMATVNGARALGVDAGVLEPGRKADVILVDARADFFDPSMAIYRDNLLTRLVFSTNGSRTRTSIIDGQVVMRDGKFTTIDEDEVTEGARKAVAELLERTAA